MRRLLLVLGLVALAFLATACHSTSSASPAASAGIASLKASANAWEQTPAGQKAIHHAADVVSLCGAQTQTVKTIAYVTTPRLAVTQVVTYPGVDLHPIQAAHHSVAFVHCVKLAFHGLAGQVAACFAGHGVAYGKGFFGRVATALFLCGAGALAGQQVTP